jgi:purine-binding chemotaxis protein CheW
MDEKKKTDLSELLQLVSFKIGEEEFGIEILKVQEIIKMMFITKIPNTPEFIEGIINLRGRIIPVVDLRTKLGLTKQTHTKNTRIVVVELNNHIVGFVVDEVSEVIRITKDTTEEPPAMISGINREFVTAIGKLEDRLLILLDLEKVFSSIEYEQLKDAV